MSGFDWSALMRLGLTGLRLTPDAFWHLTPAELRLMLGPDRAGAAMDRAGLQDLMLAFPDGPRSEEQTDGRN
jgi:uncharacterized phage protein (TIGR02216 family)